MMMMMVERSFVVAILLLSPVVFALVQPTTDPQSGEVTIGFYNASALLVRTKGGGENRRGDDFTPIFPIAGNAD